MSATIALSDRGSSPTGHATGLVREDHSMSFPLEQDKTLQNGDHTSRGGGKPNIMSLQDSMPNGHAEPARRPSSPDSELDTVTAELGDTISLNQLQTESCDAAWAERIDTLGTADLCAEFINHESSVLPAITAALPVISALVDALVKRLRAGGRVFYVGAGNSGRVASMDCSEMGPTFSDDPSQFIALVAGGSRAVMQAREDAEDSESNGAAALEAMQPKAQDAIIGISASGRTPFVLGALRAARNAGALTAGITNCQPSGFGRLGVQYLVKALTGPEFIAGSTRLKAGTAAKQILNMISTITMVRLGKTYRGLMLDVRARNHKLRVNVKLACAVAVSGLDLAAALERLERVNGRFYEFLALSQPSPLLLPSHNDELVLAIDGGGTNCKVAVATRSGQIAHGEAGACNITCATPDELVTQIRTATLSALTNLRNNQTGPSTKNKQQCLVPETDVPRFSRVWAGISGLHYSYNPAALAYRLETLLSVSVRDGSLRMTSDAPLLGACVGVDDSVQGGLCVIAGTGSVAVAVRKRPDGSVDQVSRAGGWGHLLGDDGSAFDIGRRALQAVLADMALLADEAGLFGEDLPDQGHASDEASDLEKAVLTALGTNDPAELLPLILYNADREPKHQIAEVARVVTALAFPDDDDATPDTQALDILQNAASSLVVSIKRLATSRLCTPSSDMLILSGAMLNLAPYRALFLDAWESQGLPTFRKTVVVKSASEWATRFLLRQTAS
ncbi:hypothetical protein SPBR_00244 [Sporothrix brasiliensis 5110]|uniref:N-acetyl-D-glucosamine kinase n=1 Tax=Sporothrix brasiliensis 5110 TaxID=1398154 RepID=A0A0C2ITC3_9PEZI|nr:uncharacterized protein SPBR_00244 [Sporothrix brasiliensis 5110]KIH90080.1 hypothetical protein SPBR_00244 [Sporothrix brasiliensis 5110]